MKLYTNPFSPNARKVTMTARALGIALDEQMVNLMAGEQRRPEFLRLNPNGLVPVLEDGDFVLWESDAIMQYLASRVPGNTLWPDDPAVRADITRWQCWELAHWAPACGVFLYENFLKQLLQGGGPNAGEVRRGEEKFRAIAEILNRHLAARDFLVGHGLTLADLSVAAYLMYAKPARIPLDEHDHIKRWFGRIQQLDAWKQTEPPMLG